MHFKENKEEIEKRAVFVLLIILTAVFQNTGGLFPRIFGASPMLLVPLTVCIGMFENDMGGMLLGLTAGVIWDFYSANVEGLYGIMLLTAGYAAAFLIARYMRNNVVTACVYSFITSFLCATLYFLFYVLPCGTKGAGEAYLKFYLVSVLYTLILTPVYYFFVRAVAVAFRKEEAQAAEERA